MGEVWRATDSRLKRDVAIKVLPQGFTEDRERLARFEREAQLLAQLHHPNIASIFGLEEADGVRALVMELVEGPTLAERLAAGALPLPECLAVARQIAEALETAHEKGIIHRDLKPQNIKASIEGTVKVLDFGLAKAMDPAVGASGSASQLAASPTLTLGATVQGMILGTAAYMSPEQARGTAVDKRADIWAFGVVLYEMLTGASVFAAETVSDTLAGVLRAEIDFSQLPESTPPALRRLLRRCLQRRPQQRLRDIGDARLVIAELESGVVDEPATVTATVQPGGGRTREILAWTLAALLTTAVALLLWNRAAESASAPRVIRATLPLPSGVSLELDGERSGMPALSPDGEKIAFGAREGAGPMKIWVQDLAGGAARALPGTEGGYRPFWSPDARSIGFFTWGSLLTTPSGGGPVTRLTEARDARGGTWSPNGTIVFAPHPYGPLYAISDRGGEARPVTGPPEDGDSSGSVGGTHRFPQFLPDGETFLYLDRMVGKAGSNEGAVVAGRIGSAEPVARLLDRLTNAVYADRHLLSVRDGALVAQPFDPDQLVLSGSPSVLVSDLLFNQRFTYGVFSVSNAGLLSYLSGRQSDLSQLVWRDRAGRRLGELGTPGNISGFGGLSLSPDGKWAAVSRVSESATDADIWIFDLERGTETQLAHAGTDEFDPVFTRDSGALLFGARDGALGRIVRHDLARGDETEIFSESREHSDMGPMSLTPDDATLVVDRRFRTLQADVTILPLTGAGEPRTLVATEADEVNGQVSPDGRWIAWSSDAPGRYEIFVDRFPGGGARVQISRSGGAQPRWSPRGDELFFKTPDNMLHAVPIETGSGTISVGAPVPLFQIVEFFGWTYAVAADGERFLVREPIAEHDTSPITLLTDWTALVEQR